MSGIVGSYFNTRGSGIVAKLGTDGQVFTSTGPGLSQGFEAAAGGGKLLQTLTTVVTGRTGITAGAWTATPLTVDITPSATSSKILLMTHFVSNIASHNEHQWTFFRDSTNLGDGDDDSTGNGFYTDSGAAAFRGVSFMCLDSPSSTSEITYAVYGKRLNYLNGGTQYLGGPSDSYDPELNLIAMEIGA